MTSTFYARLREKRGDDDALAACIERVVNQLEDNTTSGDSPGMLLGKIQSGKTRAFVGVIARAFDRNFDVAVILTKGTKTLSAQTVARLTGDFKEFIDEDECLVFDIMKPPGKLTRSEQRRKLVIVVKKQADNMRRLHEFFDRDYPDLRTKNMLLIDDEADLASVRFIQSRNAPEIEQGRIANQIDDLRRLVTSLAFLQVTATPYSLYLQPEEYGDSTGNEFVFKPKKPAFTELLPIHGGYVGGDDYFGSKEDGDPCSFLFVEVDRAEQDALRRQDRRRIKSDQILYNNNTVGIVRAITTFILAVCVRRWQQAEVGEKKRKYAMVIHNDTQTKAHSWQEQVIEWISSALTDAANNNPAALESLFEAAYLDLSASIHADRGRVPDRDAARSMFLDALQGDDVVRETVNKDNDVMALLDDNAELRLRTPFNIFLGGNILDRGITIPNLIAFYYGRNPRTMQADTVLQHSRMYGNRDRRDLAATRFYTSQDVYDRLYTINGFENALRGAFENGAHEQGVVFIQADPARTVRPCAPNKLLLSNVVAVGPSGLYLPTGFQTKFGREMEGHQRALDGLIPEGIRNQRQFVEIERTTALEIMALVEKTLVFDDKEFEWSAMRGLMDYYSEIRGGDGKVLLLAETGRELSKRGSGDKSGRSILGPALRGVVLDPNRSKPALVMLQQEGRVDLDWKGHRFWWPILAAPSNVEPCVFATKVVA